MNIVVDCRELGLLPKLDINNTTLDLGLNITSKSLDLGDVIINDLSENPLVIFERKTLYDLAASIKDGRYNEQSERLINSISLNNHNIIYIIEGNLKNYNEVKGRIEKKALYSAMTDLNYFKGFSVINTLGSDETAEFIIRYCDKLNREFKKGKLTYEKVSYDQTLKTAKKANVTKDNIYIIMLNQIPGVSSKISKVILDHCVNFKKLIELCENNPKELYDLSTVDKNNKSRKISKTTIDKIVNFLI